MKTLHEICIGGQSEAARVAAACAILDRAYGKPKQQVDVSTNEMFHVEPVSKTLKWLEEVLAEPGGREALPPPCQQSGP